MIIHNLDNGQFMVKHVTAIDPTNEFLLGDDVSEELSLFDRFFKRKLREGAIAVQTFEIVDKEMSFSGYFAPKKIWEDTNGWMSWFDSFQSQHSLFLYFYQGKDRTKEIFSGAIDVEGSVNPPFNNDYQEQEFFAINDYFLSELNSNSTIQIHLNTDMIYECLKKSTITECRDLLKEFNYELLNKTAHSNSEVRNIKPKL